MAGKRKPWDTVCSVCAAGVSVVCMSSMAAALAAAGAAAGAGATGAAGMVSMGSARSMGSAPAQPGTPPLLPGVFERLGLGFFNRVPNAVLQPLLVALLVVSVGAAYLAYRWHGRPQALLLTVVSAVVMYASIYVWMSDALYWLSLAGLVGAAAWGMYLTRHPARVPPVQHREVVAAPGG